MNLRVSFTQRTPAGNLLGHFDSTTGAFSEIRLPGLPDMFVGAAGLCRSGDCFYVLLTEAGNSPYFILEFDGDYRVRRVARLTALWMGHSLVFHGGSLYAVSIGTGALLRISPEDFRPTLVLSFNGDGLTLGDRLHLNSVCVCEDDILCTGFGPLPAGGWRYAREGFVFSRQRGHFITGLLHPHTVFRLDGRICLLESLSSRVLDVTDGPERIECRAALFGYRRGACHDDRHLVVGSSGRRLVGKHHERHPYATAMAPPLTRSWLHVIDRHTAEVASHAVPCDNVEIFDLCPLGTG